MAYGTEDELVIDIKTQVDDSSFINFKEDLKKNREQSIKIKPILSGGDTSNLNGNPDQNNPLKSSDKTLKSIDDTLKKSKDLLTNDSKDNKKKKEEEKDTSKGSFGIGGPLTEINSAISLMKTAWNLLTLAPLNDARKELFNKSLGFASLSYQTGQTVEAMSRLSYQAKTVGLSFEQIKDNATSFVEGVFSGTDQAKASLLAGLGYDLPKLFQDVKTPEQAAEIQKNLMNQLRADFKASGRPEFVASAMAANLAGIPQDQAFGYQYFNTKENRQRAQDLQNIRGTIGGRDNIMQSYGKLTTDTLSKEAAADKILSSKTIEILSTGSMDITAQTINLIGNVLNSVENQPKNAAPVPLGYYPTQKKISNSAKVKAGN